MSSEESIGLPKDTIFRNTKNCYCISDREMISKEHLTFCKQYSGQKILDFGCSVGDYCIHLNKAGFDCVGVDINEEYIRIAKKKGVEAYSIKDRLPFDDNSFDSVIMIDVLEHIQYPLEILREIKRVTRKNILITVPNCQNIQSLNRCGLTYAHFLEVDHKLFFTKDSLNKLLLLNFEKIKIFEGMPIYPYYLFPKSIIYYSINALYKLGFLKPKYFQALFAVIEK